ncbi:MAG: hypothetical protein JNM99_11265 [Verrucomicrobiaceae bacterium]|nr:hypothetical protein [Verrucomicrobiaceae bacterium]
MTGDYPLTGFLGMITGIEFAKSAITDGQIDQLDQLIPDGFSEFVAAQFGEGKDDNTLGWWYYVTTNTGSEKEAFDLFCELRSKCINARAAGTATPSEPV